jgi:catechol 2,3-dioxygenase-like lactoylglutathione lyase family enzyme
MMILPRSSLSQSSLLLLLFLSLYWSSPSESMSILPASSSSSSKNAVAATTRIMTGNERLLTLGAPALRQLVLEAAAREEQESGNVDLMGIFWLEHINLVVGSSAMAAYFYQDFLGLTRDPTARFHVNLGRQQFHLDEGISPQVICGSIGLVVPSLHSLRNRLDEATVRLRETQFRVIADHTTEKNDEQQQSFMTISCPFGNIMHIYDLEDGGGAGEDAPRRPAASGGDGVDDAPAPRPKMVQWHARGGPYSHATRMGIHGGQPGIRYIEIASPAGTADKIGHFYKQMLGCQVHHLQARGAGVADEDDHRQEQQQHSVVAVNAGPGVHLIFSEVGSSNDDSSYHQQRLDQMKGMHICIYAAPVFRELYQRLAAQSLVWTNPRFTHLDRCDTVDEALAARTLRFKNIVDLESGKVLLELEHETRSTRHGQYLKVLSYEPK